MARLGIAVAGGIAGFVITGGNPLGAQLGFAAGLALGGLLFPEKLPTLIGPRLSDLNATTSNYGNPIRKTYGTMRLGGTAIWSPPLEEKKNSSSTGGGFKGVPSGKLVSFSYFTSMAVQFGEGELSIIQLFFDGKLVYDCTGEELEVGNLGLESGGLEVYRGTTTQLPSPTIQANPTGLDEGISPQPTGVDITPAYRGICYIVLNRVPVADFANRRPVITAVVTGVPPVELYLTSVIDQTAGETIGRAAFSEDKNIVVTATSGRIAVYDIESSEELVSVGQPYLNMQTDNSLGHHAIALDRDLNVYVNVSKTVNRAVERFDYPSYDYVATTGFTDDNVNTFGLMDGSTGQAVIIMNPHDLLTGEPIGGIQLGAATAGDSIYVFSTLIDTEITYTELDAASKTVNAIPIIRNHDLGSLYGYGGVRLWTNCCQGFDGRAYFFHQTGGGGSPANTEILVTIIEPIAGNIIDHYIVYIGESGDQGVNCMYVRDPDDPEDDFIILADRNSGDAVLNKLSLKDKAITKQLKLNVSTGGTDITGYWRLGPNSKGKFWVHEVTNHVLLYEFDVFDFELTGKTVDASNFGVTGDPNGLFFEESKRAFWLGDNGQISRLLCERCEGDPSGVPLPEVLEDICSRVNLSSSDLNIHPDLSNTTVQGFTITDRMPAQEAINSISPFYRFRVHESDFQINFVPFGGDVTRFIPDIDLGVSTKQGGNKNKLVEEFVNPIELPRQMDIVYSNPNADYQSITQTAKLPTEFADGDGLTTINVPVASNAQYAKRTIEILLYTLYNQIRIYNIEVDWSYIDLDPNDIIQFNKDGKLFDMLIRTSDFGADLKIKLSGVKEGVFTYVESDSPGVETDGNTGQKILPLPATDFFMVDSVLIRDINDGLNVVTSAGARTSKGNWPGAQFLISRETDSITDFEIVNFFDASRNAIQGFATNELGDFDCNVWDETNTITVKLWRGTLASDSDLNVINGANAAFVGQEIIQWSNATLNADGTYTLSRLLRGRRGSDVLNSHQVGDNFIVLNSSHQLILELTDNDLSSIIYYRAPTLGKDADSGFLKQITFEGNSEKPLSPVHVRAIHDENLDWIITWVRRSRTGQEWVDLIEIPIGETTELYNVDILDNDGTILRTFAPTVETITYTKAQQQEDLTSPQTDDRLIADVYQISSKGRAGFKTRIDVPTTKTLQGNIYPLQIASTSSVASQHTDVVFDNAPTAGNLLVILASSVVDNSFGSNRSWATLTGWNEHIIVDSDTGGTKCGLFWKISDGSETTTQFSFDNPSSDQTLGIWKIEVAGSSISSPGDLDDWLDQIKTFSTTTNLTSFDPGRIHFTNFDGLVIAAFCGNLNSTTVPSFITTWDNEFIKMDDFTEDPGSNNNILGASAGYKIVVDGRPQSVNIGADQTLHTTRAIIIGIK